jgi:RNA polymerase sigma-54 factor
MSLMQRLEIRQGQSLVMTPQLLQAIKLLQLSHLDLSAYVEAELERNPLLERPEPEPVGAEPGSGAEVEREPGDWLQQDLDPARSDLARETTGLDNVFADEPPVPVRHSGQEGADTAPLVASPWGGGGSGFDGDGPDFEATLTGDVSLAEHLERQLTLATADFRERLVGTYLINAIDEAGYLTETVEEAAGRIGAPVELVGRVLSLIQTFDPPGIGARSLAECLAIQLRERDRFDPAIAALIGHLHLVARRDIPALKRICGVDEEDVADMLAEIRRLEPKPGRAFGSAPVDILVPDVLVRSAPDRSWIVELNPETLPRVLVNQTYYARVSKTARSEGEKAFLTDCMQNAQWLARSLDQRAKTILKVATEIVRQQDGFFRNGVAYLRPLNLKTVADEIGMHESTVSRVTSNKAIGTIRGTFGMKYFFTAAIAGAAGAESHSSEAVRHRIRQLIDSEGADDVLSDDALVQKLKEEGIDIARRTVAKYRESLRIPSSVERRRTKQDLRRAS